MLTKPLSILHLRMLKVLEVKNSKIMKTVIFRPVTPEDRGSSPLGPARKSKGVSQYGDSLFL